MCLIIDKRKHQSLKPIKLDKDLIVSKGLVSRKDDEWLVSDTHFKFANFVTPYRQKSVHFLFGRAILRAKLDKPYYRDYSWRINKGIHAWLCKNNLMFLTYSLYNAVIPKGTKVYFGMSGDIVAEKLIIYKKWRQQK